MHTQANGFVYFDLLHIVEIINEKIYFYFQVIREIPPKQPPLVGRKLITISGKQLPPPPRKVVIERLPPIPTKPQPLIVERWLPYLKFDIY